MAELPAFEQLMEMADKDPQAFDEFRRSTCQAFIDNTPHQHHHRLRAVQHRVDIEIHRAKTPMAGLLRVSGMMHDSLHRLSSKLVEFRRLTYSGTAFDVPSCTNKAEVIDLREYARQTQQRH